jgi:hypothetical protein
MLAVETLFAALRALILFPVHGALTGADRTGIRPMLMGSASLGGFSRIPTRRGVNQPDFPWTISRIERIHSPFARLAQRARWATDNLLHRRHGNPESPGVTWAMAYDETRNPDQREPAGDPGRHHRGRPAR